MNEITPRDKLKKIIYDMSNNDTPVKLEWLTKCNIDIDNDETFTDENLECLEKYK